LQVARERLAAHGLADAIQFEEGSGNLLTGAHTTQDRIKYVGGNSEKIPFVVA